MIASWHKCRGFESRTVIDNRRPRARTRLWRRNYLWRWLWVRHTSRFLRIKYCVQARKSTRYVTDETILRRSDKSIRVTFRAVAFSVAPRSRLLAEMKGEATGLCCEGRGRVSRREGPNATPPRRRHASHVVRHFVQLLCNAARRGAARPRGI